MFFSGAGKIAVGYYLQNDCNNVLVTTHVVRLKLFRLHAAQAPALRRRLKGDTHALPPATQGKEKHDCNTLTECDSCIKHGFKIRFFLTVFAQRRRLRRVQPSAYIPE